MAFGVKKLSQIATAGATPALTDQVVGVGSGANDLLYSLSQIEAAVVTGIASGDVLYSGGASGILGNANFTTDGAGNISAVGVLTLPTFATSAIRIGTDPVSGQALNWVNVSNDTHIYSFFFNKDRDATNARRYIFTDIGGLQGDANGAAFWRGMFLNAPPITDPVGGGNVFPSFSSYFEYDTLSAPTSRLFVWDMGNITNTTAHTFEIRSQGLRCCRFVPIHPGGTNWINILMATTTNPPSVQAGGTDTNIDLSLLAQGSGTIKFGTSTMFSANGTVATTITSLGPTGSHTTIQEWLTIKNAGGTVRYIPCY